MSIGGTSFINFAPAYQTSQTQQNYTTMAVGEEGGGITSMALGEEGGQTQPPAQPPIDNSMMQSLMQVIMLIVQMIMKMFSSQQNPTTPPQTTTQSMGEEGGMTTMALGEEGGQTQPPTQPPQVTTLAVGEEGGSAAVTQSLNETGGNMPQITSYEAGLLNRIEQLAYRRSQIAGSLTQETADETAKQQLLDLDKQYETQANTYKAQLETYRETKTLA